MLIFVKKHSLDGLSDVVMCVMVKIFCHLTQFFRPIKHVFIIVLKDDFEFS